MSYCTIFDGPVGKTELIKVNRLAKVARMEKTITAALKYLHHSLEDRKVRWKKMIVATYTAASGNSSYNVRKLI